MAPLATDKGLFEVADNALTMPGGEDSAQHRGGKPRRTGRRPVCFVGLVVTAPFGRGHVAGSLGSPPPSAGAAEGFAGY